MATPKYIFSSSNGLLVVELDNSSIQWDNDEISSYRAASINIFNSEKISLFDFGEFVKEFIFENIGTINGVTPSNIEDAYNLLFDLIPSGSSTGLEIEPEADRLLISDTNIFSWGDSLTQGTGGGGVTYPNSLSTLTNFTITNKGVGGETSTQIKDRLVADVANYNKSVVIWAGRNNYTSPETVKADIATMVATLGHTRYLVCSVLNGNYGGEYKGNIYYDQIVQLNNDLKSTYGDKYVELREYLVSLHDNSTQDLLDFSRDIPPYSLRSDDIHLNGTGYLKVAEYLNEKLSILFNREDLYLQAKDFAYYSNLYNASNSILNQSSVAQSATFNITGSGISNNLLTRNGTSANFSKLHTIIQTGIANRWAWGLVTDESSSNLGSNLFLNCFNDGGSLLYNPLVVFRSTGNILVRSATNSVPAPTSFNLEVQGSFKATSIVTSALNTSASSYDIVTRATTGGAIEKIPSTSLYRLRQFTVATLPSGVNAVEGDTAYVTDALTPVYLQPVAAGGTVKCKVFFNGTNWIT